jgi:hypothetical protein
MQRRKNPPTPAPVPVTNNRTGLRALHDAKFIGSYEHERQHSRADRAGAHPDILEFEKRFLRRMRMHNVPMFSHCVIRTGAEQDRLYEKRVSNARAGESAHNYGMATDLIHGRLGWNLEKVSWEILGHIGKEVAAQAGIPIEWGGDWKFWDPAHWELKNWRELRVGYPFG